MNETIYTTEYVVEQIMHDGSIRIVAGPLRDDGPDNTSAKTTVFKALAIWRKYNPTNTYRVSIRMIGSRAVCETCESPNSRETVGMVCQACGTDYSESTDAPVPLGEWKIKPPAAAVDQPWPMCTDHKEVQHRDRQRRDRQRRWCNTCGWNRGSAHESARRLGNVR